MISKLLYIHSCHHWLLRSLYPFCRPFIVPAPCASVLPLSNPPSESFPNCSSKLHVKLIPDFFLSSFSPCTLFSFLSGIIKTNRARWFVSIVLALQNLKLEDSELELEAGMGYIVSSRWWQEEVGNSWGQLHYIWN